MRRLFFFFLMFWYSFGSLTILELPSIKGEYPAVGYKFIGRKGPYNIFGEIVLAEPSSGCSVFTNDIKDKIVIVEEGYCLDGQKARNAQNAGAKAILVYSPIKNIMQAGFNNYDGEGLEIPILNFVPGDSYTEIHKELLKKSSIKCSLSPDANWLENEQIWLPYSFCLIILFVVCLFTAIYRLYTIFRIRFELFGLPQFIFYIEIFSNLVRIFVMLEPHGIGRGIIRWQTQTIIFTLSWPYNLIVTLLIALRWKENLDGHNDIDSSLKFRKMKYPAIFLVSAVLLLDHITSMLRSSFVTSWNFIVFVESSLLLLVSFSIATVFLIYGIKMLKILGSDLRKDFLRKVKYKQLWS